MNTTNPPLTELDYRRRFRRILVRIRTWRGLVPSILVGFYIVLMLGLSRIADQWIVALAAVPLLFAIILTAGCLAAYRKDFYA